MTPDQLKAVETEVNQVILANYPVKSAVKSLQQAKSEGAMALFGEKYGETVRTVIIENGTRYSYELCGGVHVSSTADIGMFLIVSEGSVSAGVRRVEALTGSAAVAYIQQKLDLLADVAGQLQTTPENVVGRVAVLQDELSQSRKLIEKLRRDVARQAFNARIGELETIGGVSVMVLQVEDTPVETLREMSDWFKGKAKSGIFVAGSSFEDKPVLMVTVTDDLTKTYQAGNIIKQIAPIIGGGGGGRPNMAQAGGKDTSKLADALAQARVVISQMAK
jgi:alanyl-tRNA synthetase